jgi:hypothetical protein
MTTPEPVPTTPETEPDSAPTPLAHPDPTAAVTSRWESEGGHLHR